MEDVGEKFERMVQRDPGDVSFSMKGGDPGLIPPSLPIRQFKSQGHSTRTFITAAPHFTEEELVAMIDALERVDQISEKTWSRKVVENILHKVKTLISLGSAAQQQQSRAKPQPCSKLSVSFSSSGTFHPRISQTPLRCQRRGLTTST